MSEIIIVRNSNIGKKHSVLCIQISHLFSKCVYLNVDFENDKKKPLAVVSWKLIGAVL